MLTERLKARTWFEFAEGDIKILKPLWMKFKFEEMPPFFFTKQIPDEVVPQYMKDYLQGTGREKEVAEKAGWGIGSAIAVAVWSIVTLVCRNTVQSSKLLVAWSTTRRRRSLLGLWSRWQMPGAPDMWTRAKLFWVGCSNSWKKRLWKTHCSAGAADVRDLHQGWEDGACTSAIWKSSDKHMTWKAGRRVSQSIDRSKSELLCVSWKTENFRVLLWLLRSVFWASRPRVDSDGRSHLCWLAWGHR